MRKKLFYRRFVAVIGLFVVGALLLQQNGVVVGAGSTEELVPVQETTTSLVSIAAQTTKPVYDFPCEVNYDGNWGRVRDAKDFTTEDDLLNNINYYGIFGHNPDGAIDLNLNTNNIGNRTYL